MKLETRIEPTGLAASALFSDDKVYRYELLLRWSPAPMQVGWLLNPSTGDQNALDDTLKGFVAGPFRMASGASR